MVDSKIHMTQLCNWLSERFNIEITGEDKGKIMDLIYSGKLSKGKPKMESYGV